MFIELNATNVKALCGIPVATSGVDITNIVTKAGEQPEGVRHVIFYCVDGGGGNYVNFMSTGFPTTVYPIEAFFGHRDPETIKRTLAVSASTWGLSPESLQKIIAFYNPWK